MSFEDDLLEIHDRVQLAYAELDKVEEAKSRAYDAHTAAFQSNAPAAEVQAADQAIEVAKQAVARELDTVHDALLRYHELIGKKYARQIEEARNAAE